MTVTILIITTDKRILSTTSDAFLTTAAHTTSPSYGTIEEILGAIPALCEAGRPVCIGYPPTWPKAVEVRLAKASGGGVVVPSSLLSAYGCGKGSAAVVEVGGDGEGSVGVVVDWQPQPAASTAFTSIDTLTLAITQCLQNIDMDKRPAVMDNLIVTGSGWSPKVEEEILIQAQRLSTVSTFPGDLQVRSVTTRHCPEYHVEVLKVISVESLQPIIAVFGATISCRALLTESARQ